jgi:RNA polymerase sigma-70 factor, ECF subfamily
VVRVAMRELGGARGRAPRSRHRERRNAGVAWSGGREEMLYWRWVPAGTRLWTGRRAGLCEPFARDAGRRYPLGVTSAIPDPHAEQQRCRAAANGDATAFAQLYHELAPSVERTARWLLGATDLDDAVQECFIRIWERLGQFRGDSSLRTWSTRVAVSVLLRHRARRSRWSRDAEGDADAMLSVPAAPPPDVIDRLALSAAIDALPDGARDVFVLTQIEDLPHDEVARLLDISAATSRSQLRRARLLLQRHLSDHTHDQTEATHVRTP